MNVKLCFIFNIILAIMANLCYSDTCVTLPISVSDATICTNGVCTLNELANVAIPASEDSTACYSFTSPSKDISPFTVNVTVVSAFYSFDSDYCYFTDDPAVESKGFCGCPAGTATSCTSCPFSNVNGNDVLCTSGLHNSNQCFGEWFGESGTYCLNTGLTGFKRFKVCHYNTLDHKITLDVKLSNFNKTFQVTYTGEPISFDHPSAKFNLTFVSLDAQVKFRPEFSVLDLHSPTTVYFLGSDAVNGITEYSPTKIGWYKTDKPVRVPYAIQSQIDVRVRDCNTNQFDVTYPWLSVETFLTQAVDKRIDAVSPNSYYIDSDVDKGSLTISRTPQHTDSTSVNLALGIIGYDAANRVYYAGQTYDGTLISPQPLRMTNWWDGDSVNGTEIVCPCSCTPTGSSGLCFCNNVGCVTQVGSIIVNPMNPFYCSGTYATPLVCVQDAVSTTLILYPHHRSTSIFAGNGTYTQTSAKSPDTTVTLDSSIGNGVVNLQLQFKNFTVAFEQTTITPKIVAVKQDNEEIVVTAKSLTNPGTCYLSSEPSGFIHLNPISLVLTSTDYRYSISLNQDSDVSIIIRCFDKTDTKVLTIAKFSDDESLVTQGATVRNPVDYFSSPGHLVGDLSAAFDSDVTTHWANTLISIAMWVAIAIASVLVIFGLVKLTMYLRLFKRGYNSSKLIKLG